MKRKIIIICFMTHFILAMLCNLYAYELKSQALDFCIENSDQNDLKITDCYSAEYEIQDNRLNVVYKDVINQLHERHASDEAIKHFVSSQRSWVKFKDEYSSFLYADRGTGGRVMAISWLASVTAQRADELQDFEY